MARGLDGARVVTLAAGAVGGGLLLAAVFLPWSRSGAGSAISARDLGDLALSGTVEAWVSRWLGAAVYLVPAAGALLLVGSGLGGRAGVALNVVALLASTAVTVAALLRLTRDAHVGVGPGAMLAVIGSAAGALATVAESWGTARADLRRPPTR